MSNFFSKDPAKALVEIKEALYHRLDDCQHILEDDYERIDLFDAGYDRRVKDEVIFLKNFLDKIERS